MACAPVSIPINRKVADFPGAVHVGFHGVYVRGPNLQQQLKEVWEVLCQSICGIFFSEDGMPVSGRGPAQQLGASRSEAGRLGAARSHPIVFFQPAAFLTARH